MRSPMLPTAALILMLGSTTAAQAQTYELTGPTGTPMISIGLKYKAGSKSGQFQSPAFPLQETLPDEAVAELEARLDAACVRAFPGNTNAQNQCKSAVDRVVTGAEQVYAQLYAQYEGLEAQQMVLTAGATDSEVGQAFVTLDGLATSSGAAEVLACGPSCEYLSPVSNLTIPLPASCSVCKGARLWADARFWTFNALGASGQYSPNASFTVTVKNRSGAVVLDVRATLATAGGNTYTAVPTP